MVISFDLPVPREPLDNFAPRTRNELKSALNSVTQQCMRAKPKVPISVLITIGPEDVLECHVQTWRGGRELRDIYIGKQGRTMIGCTVHELAKLSYVVSSFQTWTACDNLNRYMNAELADIHFIYGLANENGHVVVRLYGGKYPTRWQLKHQTFVRVH
ncbi:hypothetical protein TNCV_1732561 [Trichonephila clavipes]|nr:hypothetical protein TNCV_1732561 [Trichonephila clavipes]